MKGWMAMWKAGFLTFYLLVLSIFDGKEKRVPMISLAVGVAAALAAGIYGAVREQAWLGYMAGLLPGVILLLAAWTTKKAGCADGVVLAVVGAFEGFRSCVLIFAVSLLMLSACSIALLTLKKVRKDSIVPYIPFLCAGYLFWKAVEGI